MFSSDEAVEARRHALTRISHRFALSYQGSGRMQGWAGLDWPAT